MRVAICGDSQQDMIQTEAYFHMTLASRKIVTERYVGGDSLSDAMQVKDFDLIVVMVSGAAGIDVIYAITDAKCDGRVIWINENPDFAYTSYRLGCGYFIKKPAKQSDITRALTHMRLI